MTELQLAHIGLWVGALLTLMIFSFLYKDNPFYKFAEHLFVGVSAAYWMVQGFWATLMPNLIGKIWPSAATFAFPGLEGAEPRYTHLIALVFGLLLLTRLIPPIATYARMAMSMVIGFAAGTNLTRYLASDFVNQISHTFRPFVVTDGGFNLGATFNNLVLVFGVIAGLIYFFFSAEHKGVIGKMSRVGIWVLMVSFGAAFGYTVMARVSLLTGRMEYLRDWVVMIFGSA